MRFASLFEVTSTGRGIKMDAPRSMEEAQAFLAMAYAGQQPQTGQRMGMAVKGGDAGNVIDAFHRRDCQVPFNVPGMGKVDTGQPSGAMNNNAAFKAGLHIGAGNKPSIGGGGGQMGGMQNQRGGQQRGGMMGGQQGMQMQRGNLAYAYAGQQGQGMGRGMGGMLAQGVGQARGTNCGDMVRQIDVMVMSKSGQYMTIRGLIDSGAGVALMDPSIGTKLGFSASDAARTIQAMGEGGSSNNAPLINIMVKIPPSTMPLAMQAVLFADGQGDVFTPFPTCDLTMRVNIDIDSMGHTITAQDTGMSMRYDCMGMGGGMMGGMNRGGQMQMQGRMAMGGRMM